MSDDMALVREFAASRSEPAFAQLVTRHINLIYSAAARRVGDPQLAEEITQNVFILLARKAGALGPRTILSGWLYRTMAFAAADAVKKQRRRQQREQEAYMQSHLNDPPAPDVWAQLSPLLEPAMDALGEKDRTVVVLRFLDGKSLHEVGAALGVSEEAARMRVSRALEKLRVLFGKNGVTLTITAIAGALAANAVQAAPAGLALTIKGASLAAAGTGTGIFSLLKIMTMTQLKLGCNVLLVAGLTTALVVQHQAQRKLHGENETLQQQMAQLQTDNATLSNRLAADTPPKMPEKELTELLKLRGEVGVLQRQTAELGRLRAENQRLQTAPQAANVQPVTTETPEQQQMEVLHAKLDNARQGVLAFIMFARDNQQQYPTNFSQTAAYLKDGADQIATNFDIVYQGAITGIANPAQTIVLMEKQPWQALNGKWMKTYGFADGHSETHAEPSGNFADWENQRLILPPQ